MAAELFTAVALAALLEKVLERAAVERGRGEGARSESWTEGKLRAGE